MQEFSAVKLTYDCQADRWDRVQIRIRVCSEPFASGGFRHAYHARELLQDGTEVECVVKQMRPEIVRERPNVIYDEAKTQMVAESYAQEFNKSCAAKGLPHRVAFVSVSVLEVEGVAKFSLEPFLAGSYVKHNDNYGHNETDDEVAAAFSYFTYIHSNKLLVICDIQGVGTFYTDPQIHTFDGEEFGGGNMGQKGIQRFLQSHVHNLLCAQLDLPSLHAGLSDLDLARKLQEQLDVEENSDSEVNPGQGQLAWAAESLLIPSFMYR